MKPRKWVIIFCAFVIVTGAALYEGVHLLEKNTELEHILEKQISPAVGGVFEFESISLGFFAVYLRDVRIRVPLNSYELAVHDIKVGFSLRRLVATRGDIGRSVSKIILLKPVLKLHGSVASQAVSSPDSVAHPGTDVAEFDPSSFPVDFLLINDGQAWFVQTGGEEILVGEHLDGRISGDNDGIEFELKGRLASFRRNLSLAGQIVRGEGRNRVSIRLDRAGLDHPVKVGRFWVQSGKLDGVVEISFSHAFDPARMDARGSVRLDNGHVEYSEGGHPLENVSVALTLDGTRIHIDTATARYGPVELMATGIWDYRDSMPAHVAIEADNVAVAEVFDSLPPPVLENFYGTGWLRLDIDRSPSGQMVSLDGGGFTILGAPVTGLAGAGRFHGNVFDLDSCRITSAQMRARISGSVHVTDSVPSWDVDWSCRADSIPALGAVGGALAVDGHSWSSASAAGFNAMVRSENLVLQGIPLGAQQLTVTKQNHRVRFVSRGNNGASVSGFVEDLFTPAARIDCSVQLERNLLLRIVEKFTPVDTADLGDARLDATVKGRLDSWEVLSTLRLNGRRLRGEAALDLNGLNDGRIGWKVYDRNLFAGDSLFPVTGKGTLNGSVFKIDSLVALKGVRLSGSVGTDSAGLVALQVVFNRVSFARINHWFFAGGLPLDSGTVSGTMRVWGTRDSVNTGSEIRVRGLSFAGLSGLATDAVVATRGQSLSILPCVVRKGGVTAFLIDTVATFPVFQMAGEFDKIDIGSFFGALVPPELVLKGTMSGSFATSDSGFPMQVAISSDELILDTTRIDSIRIEGTVNQESLVFSKLAARDGDRTRITGTAQVPWPFIVGDVREADTLHAELRLAGDLLASVDKHVDSPIGGTARGWAEMTLAATEDGWSFTHIEANLSNGTLLVKPFVPRPIEGFGLRVQMDPAMRVHLNMNGKINKVPISIETSHDIPQGYEPFLTGPLNWGVFQVKTTQGPVELHLPGFQEIGEPVDVEFKGRAPFKYFTLAGPVEKTKIIGTWVLRNGEFTFPFLNTNELPWEFDPWPYLTFEMDMIPGNRKLMYFWDLMTRRSHKLIRFVEAYLDPISKVSLLGRDLDGSFRIEGLLRSYKGSAFFGRTFDRRFTIGLDFVPQPLPGRGFDNWPVIWGSAEAFSDTSRFDRVKLTLLVFDPVSGAEGEKGRIAMVPATPERVRNGILSGDSDSLVNFNFHLSSDQDDVAGDAEREFYRKTGLKVSTLGGAGEIVGTLGEQYLHRYLLQRFEKRLARRLGLDVVSFETSIASNYFKKFYNRQYGDISNQWNMLALANVGLTVGRYVFNDAMFLKARGELVPVDELLVPEYSLGLELQPFRYLTMDFNYGIHQFEGTIEHDPSMNLQLRLPIRRLRSFLNF